MKSLRTYLIVGTAVLILYIIAQYNKPSPTNWSETYYNNQKIPFGTYILYERIHDIFPGSQLTQRRVPAYDVFVDSAYRNAAYILICNRVQPSEADVEQITEFVKAGNDVFIAANNFGNIFQDELKTETNQFYENANAEYITFVNPKLDNERQYHIDKSAIQNYFTALDTAKAVVLGETDDHTMVNFVSYQIGKGKLYLNCNPKMFSNYSMLKPQGANYAATALSYLGTPKQVIWDEYYTQGAASINSPMRVFFNNDFLRRAYYLALLGVIMYIIYNIKRRQRIIPVVEPLKNATLDFVNVVGQVYYERRDNVDIAHKKIIYFLSSLRDKYWLKTGKMDNEFTETLAHKTGIDDVFAGELVNYINYIAHQQKVTDNELIELNRLMEKFYTLSA